MRLFEGTEFDRPPRCERCGELEEACQCPPPPPPKISPQKQTARIAVEKRKRGKIVTVIRGLPEVGNDLPGILTKFKQACGAGGTVRDEMIEIQGNQLLKAKELLLELGFKVKP